MEEIESNILKTLCLPDRQIEKYALMTGSESQNMTGNEILRCRKGNFCDKSAGGVKDTNFQNSKVCLLLAIPKIEVN